MIYGYHPVRELLRRRPHRVAKVLVAARRGKRRDDIETLCRRHRVVLEAVPRGQLDALVESPRAAGRQRAPHNGFVALRRSPSAGNAEDAVEGVDPRGPAEAVMEGRQRRSRARDGAAPDAELIVLLEDVQDPRNLGALLRVCEGVGVGQVLIRDRGSAPISAVTIKASAGAAGWLPIERIVNPARRIADLQQEGFWVYGTSPEGDPPWEIDLTGKVVLCFGGEGAGLRARTRQVCDRLAGLPMRGRVESLNVATAASAMLFEALRQRCAGENLAELPESLREREENR